MLVDVDRLRVIKGPFKLDQQAIRSVCLTRLIREVLGLSECIPEQRLFITADGLVGLFSPMIGNPGKSESCQMSDNKDRGLCKLHEYGNDWIGTLENPIDVLRIVVAKNVVGASDNNTSNILVVRETRRVYGLDVGGELSKYLRPDRASLAWAFSKPPSKKIMVIVDALVRRFSYQVLDWLHSLKGVHIQRRWEKLVAEYSLDMPVSHYLSVVDMFVQFLMMQPRKNIRTGYRAMMTQSRTMESKMLTRSQTSSIIRRAIQYLRTTDTVVHSLSGEFLQLENMLRPLFLHHTDVTDIDHIAEKTKQFLTNMEITINRNIDDRNTKLHHFTFDLNESLLSPSDVALAHDLIRSYYIAVRLWVVVNELMLGLLAAFSDFGESVWQRDPTSEEIQEIHEALDEANHTLASLKNKDIPLEVAFNHFCHHEKKDNPILVWRDLTLQFQEQEEQEQD